jgi:prepilin-type processing-associated H-X9-DG protein
LIGICVILLSIFVPYVQSIRESNRRVTCERNLYTIRDAMQHYAADNNHEFPRVIYDNSAGREGYTAFTGADDENPFSPTSSVMPNDVSASLWLLVRTGYVIDTRLFICPSTGDMRDLLMDGTGQIVPAKRRGNFRKPGNLSYSYASPFSSDPSVRLNDTKPAGFALMADKNPGAEAALHAYDGPVSELARANSPNHGMAGQNVLFADGSVKFMRTPYCGIGADNKGAPGDNIYTVRPAAPTTQTAEIPLNAIGVLNEKIAPARNDDSFLVPTAEDALPAPRPRPATGPTTNAVATTSLSTTTTAP